MLTFLFILLAAAVLYAAWTYNSLQKLAQNVRESASNVQVSISKKLSSINQLIEVVKNYQAGEQLVQLKVSQDNTAAAMSNAYQQSGTVLSTIQGMADRFPNLKASEQYHRLINNIEACENEIGTSRTNYNAVVKQYNSHRLGIPTIFIARSMGFGEAPYLQFDQSGASDPNSLKEFKTDDGERLQQLLSGAGNSIAKTTRSLAQQAGNAGKLLSEKMKEAPDAKYFYLTVGGTPKGPLPLSEIRDLAAAGSLPADVQVAAAGAEDWMALSALEIGNDPLLARNPAQNGTSLTEADRNVDPVA
ncbi:MAG: LemA family protein [Flavobacteriales bacterium]|jgi:LemA protein|nr:LemA family protein [Flavobacteriales bacterium]MCB0759864.1 LemA family protein [Flavobacteriales bacterium]